MAFAVLFFSLIGSNQVTAAPADSHWYIVQVTVGSNGTQSVTPVEKKNLDSQVQLEDDNSNAVVAAVNKAEKNLADLDWTEPNGTKPGKTVQCGNASYQMLIHSFGCGVYYFEYPGNGYDRPMYGKVFGETLAAWRKEHGSPNVSIAPNLDIGQRNDVLGYFVTINR